jgi:nucleotide-binding universal stress UspA family protein
MFKNILVPFDGSSIAEGGLRLALGEASREHARLTLLYVLNVHTAMSQMQMASPSLYHRHLEGMRLHGKEVLEQARIIAVGEGIEARIVLREAEVRRAADAICEEAAQGYDVVIMGTHGRRGLDRLVNGSDAESVARSCPVPVLLVPAASSPATPGSRPESVVRDSDVNSSP